MARSSFLTDITDNFYTYETNIDNYTVTVNGTFSYASTSCSTTAKSGTFEKGSGTFWSSTPSLSQGNISTTKAYARISGTATMLWESSSYQLTLMCDTSGKLTSSFTRP